MSQPNIKVKIAMVGDANVGKTSLMVKYVEGTFDDNYIQTLGVNCMERTIQLKGRGITFSINDLGGQREFTSMLPVVMDGARVILFVFDLTRLNTLNSIKDWYKQARQHNTKAHCILIGSKYDLFTDLHPSAQKQTKEAALKFAEAMKASCVFCSSAQDINIMNIFKIALAKVFNLSFNVATCKEGAVLWLA